MEYDIIFVVGEIYFDHPLCGVAILKRLLEKKGYSVAVIEKPTKEVDIKIYGKPRLFFGVSSGAIDSMVRNYTPLKKIRKDDKNLDYNEEVPDRAVIVYSNWIKKNFKDSILVLGGVEASLRRFVHYDYWQNRLRKPILFDSRGDILIFGHAEKQMLDIAKKIKNKQELLDIPGVCIISKTKPSDFISLPSFEDVSISKEKFCDMQNLLTNKKNLAQKIDNRYILQYKSPVYTTKDLDSYYELPFTRDVPKELRGFQFSVVTHRGCIGNCNFCSLSLIEDRIISRSIGSIVNEAKKLIDHPKFQGQIDDLTGPSVNMYGMDCNKCNKVCLDCNILDKSNKKLITLLKKLRSIKGIRKVNIKSGVYFQMITDELLKELVEHHIFDTLRIAPEHLNKRILDLMNKDRGNLDKFIINFKKYADENKLSFYFMTAHPGSTMDDAKELIDQNIESVQIFTPTPMTVSTCMYYTGLNPKTKKKIYVPYTYSEKKEQKRIVSK